MAMRLTTEAANAAAGDGASAGLRAYIGATPKLKFYSGTVPTAVSSNSTGATLATVTVGAFGAAADGVISSTGGSVAATTSGEVGCWGLYKTDGTTKVADGTASTCAASDFAFDEGSFIEGGTVTVATGFTLTIPSS